jgi:hypothetical protein
MREQLASPRRSAAALALLLGACRPDLPETPTEKVVTAVFDPTTARIPLPNDLVFRPFNSNLNSVCADTTPGAPKCAQAELLESFAGEFPNDQEVAITIDFTQTELHTNGARTISAPALDFTTFKTTTFYVASVTTTGVTPVPTDPVTASDYTMSTDHGTLTIHHQGRTPWPPGSYAVVMRGGDEGVKTVDGTPVSPSQVFALIATGADFTKDENLGLLRAQLGSIEDARMQGAQLAILVQLYTNSVFRAADARFPHQELAIASTFSISDVNNVTVDAGRGIVPLPIDLLRDPRTGKLSALAACTLAGSRLSDDGTCPSPAAGGFQALDGFSTTGAILAPTSDLIIAATARAPGAVQLFDLSNPAQPVAVPAADLIIEPCEFTINPANPTQSGCAAPPAPPLATAVAPVIAIQPAGATAGDASSVFRSKPLKDATDYAVVISNAVHDKNNKPIGRGTVASILRFTNKVFADGRSQLLGVDDGTAAALEKMRLQLQPVFAALPEPDRNNVAMAYTFRTQTILAPAVQLAALPYSPLLPQPLSALPLAAPTPLTATQAFTKYGVDSNVVPSGNIDQIIEVDIETLNALDPITGAFMPDPTKGREEPIHVLIATPLAANAPACAGPLAPLAPLRCAPMMIFRHGLGSGRAAMLAVADRFAAAGMVTVAIDAAKHGDRSFCTSGPAGPTTGCKNDAACTTLLPAGAQGDARPPGTCSTGFIKRPVSPTCAAVPSPCPANTDGIPEVSANYVTSTNFFRTRDTFRQDLIDESQLIRALAFVPTGPPPTAHSVFNFMATRGVVINPGAIYYTGQSLGSVQGAMNVAANSRISKAAFNVGGGTIVDIFSNSPAFAAGTQAILDQLGIQRGTPQFLQFLVVTKTVLDPADPINFAGHLTDHTLPDLLATTPKLQDPKKILSQIANCDGIVPNPFNLIGASNIYAGNTPAVPLPSGPAFFAPNLTGAFQLFVGAGFHPVNTPFGTCPLAAVVSHSFLTDWTIPSLTTNAQNDIANFVMSDTLPLSVQHQ